MVHILEFILYAIMHERIASLLSTTNQTSIYVYDVQQKDNKETFMYIM